MNIGPGITIGSGVNITQISISNLTGLYDFTTFTFSTANIIGTGAGNLTTYKSFYNTVNNPWLNDTNYYNVVINGYQLWTVPKTGTYEIEAAGARSGVNGYVATSGVGFSNGAIIRAQVGLTQGDKLNLIAGQPAQNTVSNNGYNGAGGGGGTFVVANTGSIPILIAGGAGGAGRYQGYLSGTSFLGLPGNLGTAGANSRTFGEPGGTLGSGGRSHTLYGTNSYDGGGGGGFLTSGYNGLGSPAANTSPSGQVGGGGLSYVNNLTGGAFASGFAGQASPGGFGGGGGGSPINGGGGGGYSGGAGTSGTNGTSADGAGGGGSFIIATATNVATSNGTFENINTFNGAAIANLGTYNSGGGYIKITFIQ